MKSLLIKDTTKEEREKIVQESLGIMAGSCDGCAGGIADMYDDYIYGIKEIAEINASFHRGYTLGNGEMEQKGSCQET